MYVNRYVKLSIGSDSSVVAVKASVVGSKQQKFGGGFARGRVYGVGIGMPSNIVMMVSLARELNNMSVASKNIATKVRSTRVNLTRFLSQFKFQRIVTNFKTAPVKLSSILTLRCVYNAFCRHPPFG